MGLKSYNFPKKIIFPLSQITFENITLPCPKDVNNYLIILYGENYLIPPSNPYQHGIIRYISEKKYRE